MQQSQVLSHLSPCIIENTNVNVRTPTISQFTIVMYFTYDNIGTQYLLFVYMQSELIKIDGYNKI